jgi:acyl-CoA thioester hydrolase
MTVTAQAEAAVEYGHIEPIFVHFDDLDSMGMVHNSRYALMLERALTTYWEQHGYTYASGVPTHPDTSITVVEYSISYKTPVFGTGGILIHIWVERFGRSSVTYGFRALSADRATVHAEGRRIHVRFDPATMQAAAWADGTRAIYESLRPG